MQASLARCAVTEEDGGYLVGAPDLGAERHSGGHGNVGADDAVGAQHPLVDVGDVHRAALALVSAGRLPQELGHHFAQVDALGDAVVVAPVGAQDVVVDAEVRADPRGDRLLADGRVHPSELARVGLAAGLLLEPPDDYHRLVHPEQRVGIEVRMCRYHSSPPKQRKLVGRRPVRGEHAWIISSARWRGYRWFARWRCALSLTASLY